jgi:hypothetical protein
MSIGLAGEQPSSEAFSLLSLQLISYALLHPGRTFLVIVRDFPAIKLGIPYIGSVMGRMEQNGAFQNHLKTAK